jgi:hypothetical protein
MPRISLDVSAGTFSKIDGICKEEFRDKASYLRLLINGDVIKRGRAKGENE